MKPIQTALAGRRVRRLSERGFTLIEIAISLGVIAFALIAIIGILPMGMNVQKENREETIINQDATVLMNAICNGERGLNDLTNYVVAITNFATPYDARGGQSGPTQANWYTPTMSSTSPVFPLVNGYRIVGLLSTPKYIPLPPAQGGPSPGFLSNYVVAVFRAMSGPANDKFPQSNPSVKDFAFTYKVFPSVVPFIAPPAGPGINDAAATRNLERNLHDVRLTFRWPLLNRNLGNGRQVYRTMAGGRLLPIQEPAFPAPECTLHFFEPRTYVQAP